MNATTGEPGPGLDPLVCWDAVLARDRGRDGHFVYAVRTTGIYCRPSCPARRPRRAHVSFFEHFDAAEGAGYRACLRCDPRSREGAPADRVVRRALRYLEGHLDERVSLARLADEVGLSPSHLQRNFTARVGVSPKAYQDTRRLQRFRERIRQGDTVSRATFEAGFDSSRSLYERAGDGLGMTPGSYRRGGAGLRVRYAVVDSPLGRMLVGATSKGVCAVSLGDEEQALERELEGDFPEAELVRDCEGMRDWAEAVVAEISGKLSGDAVPLDLQGTVFQLRVWKALGEIPAGETRSYGEVAAALGRPTASRAVAGACAKNRAALVVPCHRVVRATGELGGYRWGTERKRKLLELEQGKA